MRKQLLIESIRTDGGTQSRERINEETVAEYAEAMKGSTGAPFPAVSVFFDGTEYWLADGFHRVLAARRIGRKNITAEVKQGSRLDAAWASCAANQLHGLRRTNPDKRRAVEIALELHPEMSDRAIADHCGVGRELAFDVRRQHVGILHVEKRVGVDGKVRKMPVPRPKTAGKQEVGPPPRPEERRTQGQPPARPPEPAPEAPPPKEKASVTVDDIGRAIPDHLLELWDRRQEVQDMLTALSRVRVALREAQANRDPLYSEVPFSSAIAHLDQAYNGVQVAKPYAVCAFCQGHGCKACGQRGLLGKFRWDTAVPDELKAQVERLVKNGGKNGE